VNDACILAPPKWAYKMVTTSCFRFDWIGPLEDKCRILDSSAPEIGNGEE